MEKLIINGQKTLSGEIKIQGAKNSALPILAGTLLLDKSKIKNCPSLSDVRAGIKILEHLGVSCSFKNNTLETKNNWKDEFSIPEDLMREMRSSVVFLGALISKCKRARISYPGGCELGPRPIDMHLNALSKMGVKITEDHGFLDCEAKDGLKGARICLPFPSVGATENIILAGAMAKGLTTINNAAREPEISDLASFLRKCGAKIKGDGTSYIEIEGVESLKETSYSVMPDRIVTASYLSFCAIAGGEIIAKDCVPKHLDAIIPIFEEMGYKILSNKNNIYFKSEKNKRYKAPRQVETLPYPAFPTDALAPIMAVSAISNGTAVFQENIFENRYRHVDEMAKMGADIKVSGRVAVVRGVDKIHSASLFATDLRGGAALVAMALGAEGKSTIGSINHIDRGYENLVSNLKDLGADIKKQDIA